ncbi:hypothetical protein N7495_006530 [Penicillium taxi]|uniref:uncharacterized protein n=1 Tax=Penicillium taxi TaxID=168475 RepID=UPI0025459F23|nr:uncharacterized protein N7495_006530 [Penicillium taxi]KAJ5894839.1 hypothetical protein N7495_006530 [Penicillium taxi]
MDQTPDSIYHSSSTVPSLLDDTPSLDTPSAYSSPVSATTSHGQAPIGLGISGLEPTFNNLRAFSNAFDFSAAPLMLNQFPISGSSYNEPSKSNDFPDASCYGLFQDPSYSPSSYYSAQGMSASPSYDSTFGTFVGQIPGNWGPVLPTAPTTPEIAPPSTDCLTGRYWNQAYAPAAMNTLDLPIENGLNIDTGCFMTTPPEETVCKRPYVIVSNPAPLPSDYPNVHISGETTESPTSPQTRKPSTLSSERTSKVYFCSICGNTFTRRSNCTEHERNHDPKRKKSFPCGECHKTFGRNADLKRHTDTIHRGIRKYHCRSCERRFTRLDALNKLSSPDTAQRVPLEGIKSFKDASAQPSRLTAWR